jgi:hypothetical protein
MMSPIVMTETMNEIPKNRLNLMSFSRQCDSTSAGKHRKDSGSQGFIPQVILKKIHEVPSAQGAILLDTPHSLRSPIVPGALLPSGCTTDPPLQQDDYTIRYYINRNLWVSRSNVVRKVKQRFCETFHAERSSAHDRASKGAIPDQLAEVLPRFDWRGAGFYVVRHVEFAFASFAGGDSLFWVRAGW